MTPPDKDDERKKTSPEAEAEESDPGIRKEGGSEDGPPREDVDENATPAADTSERPADDTAAAGEQTDPVRADEPTDDTDRDRTEARDDDPHPDDTADAAEVPKQSEPVTDETAPAPPPPAARSRFGGRFSRALVGALVGAAVGAGAVWYILQQMPREPDPAVTAAIDQQAGELSALAGEIEALREDLGTSDLAATVETLRGDTDTRLGGLDGALTGLGDRLDAMESRLDEIGGQVGEVGARLEEGEARIAELEARPIADPETANQALRSEVADMRAEVEQATEEARAQVETMRNELAEAAAETQAKIEAAEQRAAELEAEAQAAARAAEARAALRAALTQVDAALDSGEPYGEALATLSSNAKTEVPEALTAPAEAGVPTLGELRDSYPGAARAALGASRVATTEGDPGSRLMAFLRTQTRARSLTPQEGDAPDAILSRAEAALSEGDLTAALAELEALPEDGRAAMQDWIDSAEVRADALAAAHSLSQGMN